MGLPFAENYRVAQPHISRLSNLEDWRAFLFDGRLRQMIGAKTTGKDVVSEILLGVQEDLVRKCSVFSCLPCSTEWSEAKNMGRIPHVPSATA